MRRMFWLGAAIVGLLPGCGSSTHVPSVQPGDAGEAGMPTGDGGRAGAIAAGGDGGDETSAGRAGEAGAGNAAADAGAGGGEPTGCAETCLNPDPTHCEASCDATGRCVIQGLDKDKDGFLTSACMAKPGPDCNDDNASIHPGATEVCDHVDNDCNGKLDLADGFDLSGSNLKISTAAQDFPIIAWAKDTSVYGIGYWGTLPAAQHSNILFQTVDAQGKVVLSETKIEGALLDYAGTPFAMTWAGDAFGFAWFSDSVLVFQSLPSSGVTSKFPSIVENSGKSPVRLARNESGSWGVLYGGLDANGPLLRSKTFTDVSTVDPFTLGSAVSGGSVQSLSLAGSATNFVMGYQSAAAAGVASGTVFDKSFANPLALTLAGINPVLASGPNGFAVAVTAGAGAASSPLLYAFASTGAAQCGPVKLGDSTFVPAAMVARSGGGYLVVSSSNAGLRVQEVAQDCTLGQLFTVDTNIASSASIAAGSAGYGIAWVASSGPRFRLFGPDFCN